VEPLYEGGAAVFKVQTQTSGPGRHTLLFLVIFTVAMAAAGARCSGVSFATFVAPGLIMMGMMQNAFANSSFSLLAASSRARSSTC
jgi:ABC-2 type transport system permease protein